MIIKVLRPGIEAKAKIDFLIVDLLVFIADMFFKIEALAWKEFAKEFKIWTKQEFDYRLEAENGERLYNNNIGNPNLVIPKIYHHLTTRKILVEEYIEGLHLSRVLKRFKNGTLDEKKLKEMGVDLKKVSRILVFELLKQFVIQGFYHADPHPGNIILLKNDRIGLIDFGITGGKELMPNKNEFIRWMKATGDMDFKEASYHAANFAGDDLKIMIRSALPATVDQKEIDVFIRKLSDYFMHSTQHLVAENFEKLKSVKKDYNTVLLQVIKAGKKVKVKVPNEFIIFSRGLAILGMMAKQMDRNFFVTDELKNFFQVYPLDKLLKNEISPAIRRINRETALERLTNWLSYLFEVDPVLYQLVKKQLSQYGIIN